MRHITSLAEPEDGKEILKILESSPTKGNMELLYTRRPDAYLSYKKESNESYVYVVKEEEKIVGTAAELVRKVYIDGNAKKIAYLCGLKKDPNYCGKINWGKIFIKNLVKKDIDCYFCSIVSDNKNTQKMFEKKRKKTMNMECLQKYTTYMLAPYFKFKIKDTGYIFKQIEKVDEHEVINFLNTEGRKKVFFPVIEKLNQFTNLKAEDFYVLKKGNKILAVGALWNQTEYRQYLVKKYKGIMKIARCLNPFLKLFGYIELPKENENINFPMLSFFISKDDNEEYYKAFLNNIAKEIKKQYGMFVIGTAENSFANNIYKKLRNIHFDTKIYSIDFILGNGQKIKINREKIWLECGLL